MPASKFVKLNTGAEMPTLGLGTWKSKVVRRWVLGIAASGVKRESIFLTTKLDNPDHKEAPEALERSLKALGTSYLDLCTPVVCYVIFKGERLTDGVGNPPLADKSHDWIDTWKDMERLYKTHPDKIRAIGVSNLIPAVNQIELHPSCPQEDIVELCAAKGIVVTAYSPLGSDNSPLLTNEDQELQAIDKTHHFRLHGSLGFPDCKDADE
ncbi:NADP-dependent oxidoreductase domain-containing protein [Mycena alexandri]|uniref:NADP-dependent oxidoreductase domain-containing protein n=1 Tax=Mycena alexandri TaxID=1745969 RepID=A0AAD6RX93_9AGAR|nr:NADP-dependent oxidoreductase domain-containing protein [Mycena alexandri]